MTFNEALEFKKNIGEFIIEKDMKYTVMIVPENKNDFEKYCSEYLFYDCTDKTAMKFSSNSEYQVFGLHISNGNIILPKKLS
jgi:hypothetical protein